MPPPVISKYAIQSKIGSGGIGSVYRALDQETGETVALKLLSTGVALDAKAARRMAREFETLAQLDHENVVRVYKTGVWRGYPFLAMELIEGVNLRQYLAAANTESGENGSVSDALSSLSMDSSLGGARSLDDLEAAWFGSEDGGHDALLGGFSGAYGIDDDEDGKSGEGPDALRRLADAIDEPMTDEGDEVSDSDDSSEELHGKDVPNASGHWDGGDEGGLDDSASEAHVRRSGAHGTVSPRAARAESRRLAALNSPMRLARLKSALVQICHALAYIHRRGMVHRDIKPSNIMVDRTSTVKLMDFGLAKYLASDTEVTASGHVVGTYRYMAPEQLRGERVDGRTDLFSLGVVLYEMLAGRPPFEGRSTIEICRKILETEPVPIEVINPGADMGLSRLVPWMIAKDIEDRVQTAEDLLAMLPP